MVIVGCGSSMSDHAARQASARQTTGDPATTTSAPVQAHPQVIEPVAGEVGRSRPTSQPTQPAAAAQALDDPAPTQPASITIAPAKDAPSEAEVRAEVARFQLAIARYHLDRLRLSNALIDPSQLPPGQYNVSIASVYTDYGLPVACGGVLHVAELGVANKTLPCGTEVIFRYGGRAIRVPVVDRGPYIAGREWDLTGAAAEALHFPGLGLIDWRLG
jgi:rare lipoprotein A (peptidoglycan hydrolase)